MLLKEIFYKLKIYCMHSCTIHTQTHYTFSSEGEVECNSNDTSWTVLAETKDIFAFNNSRRRYYHISQFWKTILYFIYFARVASTRAVEDSGSANAHLYFQNNGLNVTASSTSVVY